jgi:hypothetical protein
MKEQLLGSCVVYCIDSASIILINKCDGSTKEGEMDVDEEAVASNAAEED